MVQAIDTSSKIVTEKRKDRFCNYSFETIKVDGSNYRVPVLNQRNLGKVLESTTANSASNVMQDEARQQNNTRNQNRRGENKQEKPERIDYSHFISIPIKDPIFIQNYENLKTSMCKKNYKGITDRSFTSAY